MRDIVLVAIVALSIPFILKRPALGVILWAWLSVMNPHRLTYGFAYALPLAAVAAGVTFIGLLVTKEERRLPMTPPVVMLLLFTLWMCITSLVPFHPGTGYDMWSRVMKIMLMTFVALALIHSKKQIHWLVWIIVFSLGFYGLKGGVFTAATGGGMMVWGPEGSFIEGNNEIALALVTIIPMMRYVQISLEKKWARWGMLAVMLFSVLAAIGTHSRGALVAIAAMATFLWWKSRNKFGMGLAVGIVAIAVVTFMPAEWMDRMNTIKTYEEDSSAMGRINAWWMAFNLAKANFFGGGFDIYDYDTFGRYAPNPTDVHAAHSIYFQVLGEHGFVGLFLFLAVGATTWLAASETKRKSKGLPEMAWAGQLMDMVKVSMVGYAVGGAFLSLAYYDVPYYILVIAVATRELVLKAHREQQDALRGTRPGRADRFGAIDMREDGARPDRRNADDWRSQGAFRRGPGTASSAAPAGAARPVAPSRLAPGSGWNG